MLIEKIWEKVVVVCEKHYGIEPFNTELRFVFLVYIFYLRSEGYKYNFKSTKIIKTAFAEYLNIFRNTDNVRYASFERTIYRVALKITDGGFVDLHKILKEITSKVE